MFRRDQLWVISGFLYINYLPGCLRKTTPYLYADGTQISTTANNFVENFNNDLLKVGEWLSGNKLQHHPTRTKLMYKGSKYIYSMTCDPPNTSGSFIQMSWCGAR